MALPLALLLILGGVAVACGGDDDDADDSETSSRDSDGDNRQPTSSSSDDADDSDNDSDSDDGTSNEDGYADELNTPAARWMHDICRFAAEVVTQANASGAEIQKVQLTDADAKTRILEHYGDIQASVAKYRDSVANIEPGDFDGGDEVKDLLVELTQLSVDQLDELVAELQELPEGPDFPAAYDRVVGDSGDDNSDQQVRGRLRTLQERHPDIQNIIDAIDNDPVCDGFGEE